MKLLRDRIGEPLALVGFGAMALACVCGTVATVAIAASIMLLQIPLRSKR